MTKKEIVNSISGKTGLTQLRTKEIVQMTFDAIIETLVQEGRIELRNFGVFEVKQRKARKARNPRTGDKVDVPAKYVVTFKPGKEMEESVEKVREALAQLDDQERQVMLWMVYDRSSGAKLVQDVAKAHNVKSNEIPIEQAVAERLGISQASVKEIFQRSRNKIQQMIAGSSSTTDLPSASSHAGSPNGNDGAMHSSPTAVGAGWQHPEESERLP